MAMVARRDGATAASTRTPTTPKSRAGRRTTAVSAAQAVASDVEELGYLLSCARRGNPSRRGEGSSSKNSGQQLKALLECAVRQAFPSSSSSSLSSSTAPSLSALKARWLSATALLFNDNPHKSRLPADYLARNPTHLARVIHRAFLSHSREDVRAPRAKGGRCLGEPTTKPVAAVVANASSSSGTSPRARHISQSGRTQSAAAPSGTLESTVLLGNSGADLSSSSFDASDANQVSGTDTATSSSSSDEDDEGSLALIVAQQDQEDRVALFGSGSSGQSSTPMQLQRRLYRRFVEALHLELVGRSPSVLGGQVFHVFPLTGQVRSLPHLPLHDLRRQIENEFHVLQSGGGGAAVAAGRRPTQRRRIGQKFRAAKECRVYACRPPTSSTTLWIQINIECPGLATKKEKASSSASGFVSVSRRCQIAAVDSMEPSTMVMYHIVLQDGGTHVAMTSSGPSQLGSCECSTSESPSTSKERASTAQWILAALDSAVTAVDASSLSTTTRKSKIHVYRRIESLSGPDPFDLLRTSTSTSDRTALGRFRMYNSKFQQQKGEMLTCFEDHGLESTAPPTTPRAVSGLGTSGALLQHSVRKQLERKRSHVQHFGRPEDCPKRRRIRWDIERFDSIAASTAVLAATALPPRTLLTEMPSLPTTSIKCRVVLQGPDVIAGLRALVESGDLGGSGGGVGGGGGGGGFANHHLPSCVRDAPISCYETIKVVNGAVAW